MTVGVFRDWLLSYDTTPPKLKALAPGLRPEMVSTVSKIMRNQGQIIVADKVEVITALRNTIASRDASLVACSPIIRLTILKGGWFDAGWLALWYRWRSGRDQSSQ